MKTALYYRLDDVGHARMIWAARKDRDYQGKPLYPPHFVRWAAKVLRWYNDYCAVLRRYVKETTDLGTAVRLIWASIRKGISVQRMMRELMRSAHGKPKYQKTRIPRDATGSPAVTPIRPRVAKHRFRERNRAIADRYQCGNIPANAPALAR